MKKILTPLSVAFIVSSVFATTIDTDTSWASGFTMTDQVTVTDNATLSLEGAVNTGNYGITVDAGSTMVFVHSSGNVEFKTLSPSATTENVFNIYGTIDKTGGGGVNFIFSDQSANNTVFNLHDGAVFKSTVGTMSFEVRRGTATFNFAKGSTLSGVNDINIGGRGDGNLNGTINVEGSATFGAWIRLGNTNLNASYSGKAALNVTNGGYLKTRDLGTNRGTGYDASILLKGVGSKIETTNAVVLNYVNDDRSTSVLSLYTGSNFNVLNADGLTSNSKSKVVLGLDSNIQEAASTAMFSISKLIVNTDGGEKTFTFDTSELGLVSGLSEGDIVDVILFDSLTSITFNGTEYLISAMTDAELQSVLANFVDFDFAGNEYWSAASLSDITKSGSSVILSMEYNIPEPGTYAAVFGAIALALAVYRRRK